MDVVREAVGRLKQQPIRRQLGAGN